MTSYKDLFLLLFSANSFEMYIDFIVLNALNFMKSLIVFSNIDKLLAN